MKITEIAFTAYAVTSLPRARHFYEQVLGLSPARVFGDADTGGVEYDVGPATLAITNRMAFLQASSHGGIAVFEVADLDAAVAELRAAGVKFVAEPFESPKCRGAVVADPDGNSVGLHQRKSSP